MAYGMGVQSYIQMHSETTYGTKENVATYKKQGGYTTFSVAADTSFLQSNAITANGAVAAVYPGAITFRGNMNGEAGYETLDQLLWGICGDVTQSVPTGAGGVAWDHWHEIDATPPSFTVQVSYGNLPSGKVWTFTGCYVESLELAWSAPGIVTYTATLVPYAEEGTTGGDTAQGTDATFTHRPITTHQASVWNFGNDIDSGYCITGGRIALRRPIDNTRACIGSAAAKEPVITSLLEVDGSIDVEYFERDPFEEFLAQTLQTSGQLKFAGDAISGTSTPTLYYTLDMRLPQFYLLGPAVPIIDGPGILKASFGIRPFGVLGTGAAGTPDEVSTLQPIAIMTRNGLDNGSSAW